MQSAIADQGIPGVLVHQPHLGDQGAAQPVVLPRRLPGESIGLAAQPHLLSSGGTRSGPNAAGSSPTMRRAPRDLCRREYSPLPLPLPLPLPKSNRTNPSMSPMCCSTLGGRYIAPEWPGSHVLLQRGQFVDLRGRFLTDGRRPPAKVYEKPERVRLHALPEGKSAASTQRAHND
ncbi:hypothetical protein [Tahibacter aquaticus]|uniref:hypothetical protein n=1 Tax=Tahibacter aquaticus TaxID=520092 RepID=UPI001AAC7362|nr:hypothetical protein [Tahibacter aquaticus]